MRIRLLTLLVWSSSFLFVGRVSAQNEIRTLRLSFHIFNDDAGNNNFQPDSINHIRFLEDLVARINHKMLNLDTLKPAVSSRFIPSIDLQIRIDTIFFHHDTYAWDCSDSLDSEYMRIRYVDQNDDLTYRQKYQTLPVFFGDNYGVVGGHVSQIGSKRLIAMRGIYTMYSRYGYERALFECSRNIFHELGHALGLNHNFQNGPSGEQCDECEDNGCPTEGTSNNLMDYWPSYGGGISACQLEIIQNHVDGLAGTISEVLINDSCDCESAAEPVRLMQHQTITGTQYLRNDLIIADGAVLEVIDTLSIGDGHMIEIQSGGRIMISGGTLTNLCGDLWGGIRVNSQTSSTSIEIRGGRIEHAAVGVSISGDTDAAIADCVFNQCPVAVRIAGQQKSQVRIRNCEFTYAPRFHRYEEGTRPLFLIDCEDAELIVEDSRFTHLDHFKTTAATEAGEGIRVKNSDLLAVENNFSFLTTGIRLVEEERPCSAQINHNTFDFCAAGVMNLGMTALQMDSNEFLIYRFNTFSGIGLYNDQPGWTEISNNSFSSRYGGEELTGIFVQGNREATQILKSNEFANLGYGIIEIYGEEQFDWFESHQDHCLGLVLDENKYHEVTHAYQVLTREGYGLAVMRDPPIKDISRYKMGLIWPVGGLAVFSNLQPVALALTGQELPIIEYPQHNFFINRVADRVPFDPNCDYIPDSQYSLLDNPPGFLAPFTVEKYLESNRLFSKHPECLRDSKLIDRQFTELGDWPPWAVADLIHEAEASSKLDVDMSQYIRQQAKYQLEGIFSNAGDLDNLPASEQLLKKSGLPQINYPELFFRPGMPKKIDSAESFFSVYPNPVQDVITILPLSIQFVHDFGSIGYRIFDMQGRLVEEKLIKSAADLVVQLNDRSPGVYWLQISTEDTFFGQQKFIIFRSN